VRILALETATRAGSVALLEGDAALERRADLRGEGVVAAVAALLAEAGCAPGAIDAVAVSVGPGSFTGVRIGVAAAQGFCRATGAPAVAVGTLDALAAAARGTEWGVPGTRLLASVDARRGEVYAALYRVGGPESRAPAPEWGPEAVSCAALAARLAGVVPPGGEIPGVLVGDGAALLWPLFPPGADWAAPSRLARPSAAAVARVAAERAAAGGSVKADGLEPVYLRKADAEIRREERLRQD
jgi:tRNA threonylcarbamoyladenosine biosynthesis protein TsaB